MTGPISTDDIPDKTVTRSKLGKASIVSTIGSLNQPVVNDANAMYCSIDLESTDIGTELAIQCPMLLNGKFVSMKLLITTNNLTGNVTLTLRKNGIDTSDVLTIKTTDMGLLNFNLTTEFLEGDLMSWRQNGNNTGNFVSCQCQIIIEYDG